MSNPLKPNEYKQEIVEMFDRRTNYDRGDLHQGNFHHRLAHRLIEYTEICPGQRILDLATGTGLVAIEAARRMGSQGRVVGVDFSPGMLDLARSKVEVLGLENLEFKLADAEAIEFPDGSFDTIFCCSALIYLVDIPSALKRWHPWLKPGGSMGLTGFSETAFAMTAVLIDVAAKYGVSLLSPNEPTGTDQKCYNLLQKAGFEEIKIKTEQLGSYISLEDAQSWSWDKIIKFPFNRPLLQLSAESLESMRQDYFAALESRCSEGRLWNDITTFFILAVKGN